MPARQHASMVANMKTIAVVNLKGGVGKTTAAILIATQLAELGHTVTVLDMDTQGSATDWARIADEDGTPLPFEIRPANHASLRSYKPTTDFTVIDTPPTDPSVVDAAVKVADLIIVPTPPGFMDTDRTWSTVEVTATQVPTYVLLSRFDGRTNDAADFASLLDERGVGRFETVIPASVSIGRLRGTIPDPSKFRFDDLTTELLEVL
ncbi:AAA family ATPase [Brachybacterium tyrofermentans]|uniref:AAA family ATPase n=2 Tax=Brachybacterium tyrofermentans TaxID=47848 RepID=UPI003FD1E3F7